ncbi:hypothetical protein KC19_8G031200 [Ceratodon purpureus]|uniref:Uncharacterized protein n=1 Tax=Ceratodon purpureus TaxID=3225 RepID=A0A8T0GYA8_CERPU|nr:hypothetical protein KC19_8G031200 [Ceratodon purpureus]
MPLPAATPPQPSREMPRLPASARPPCTGTDSAVSRTAHTAESPSHTPPPPPTSSCNQPQPPRAPDLDLPPTRNPNQHRSSRRPSLDLQESDALSWVTTTVARNREHP